MQFVLVPNCQRLGFDCLQVDLVAFCLGPQEAVRSLLLLLEYVEGSAEPARAELTVGAMQSPLLAAKKVREVKPAGLCQVLCGILTECKGLPVPSVRNSQIKKYSF